MMSDLERLEGMGYHFHLHGDKVKILRYGSGTAPPGAQELLSRLNRADVIRILTDRQRGFLEANPGELWADAENVLPLARKLKGALEAGILWDVRVIYHKRSGGATFFIQPPEEGRF